MIPRSGSTGSNTSEISLGSSREVHVPQEGSPAISGLVGHERVHTVSSGETESPLPSGWLVCSLVPSLSARQIFIAYSTVSDKNLTYCKR